VKIIAQLAHEKDAPKSHAYGVRTEEGILIKVWVPKALAKKPLLEIGAELIIPIGKSDKKDKGKNKKKRKPEQEDENEDEADDDEDED
jgi:hypothetical protein